MTREQAIKTVVVISEMTEQVKDCTCAPGYCLSCKGTFDRLQVLLTRLQLFVGNTR